MSKPLSNAPQNALRARKGELERVAVIPGTGNELLEDGRIDIECITWEFRPLVRNYSSSLDDYEIGKDYPVSA